MRPLCPALAALLVLAAAAPASARPGNARDHERQADDHRRAGRFDKALEGYREAWIAHPAPRYLYRLGQCEHLRGDDERALFFFQRYLDKRAVPPFKKKVQKHVAEARVTVASAREARAKPRLALLPVASGEARDALTAEEITAKLHAAMTARRKGAVRDLDRTYRDLHLASLVGLDCPATDEACVRKLMPLLQADAVVVAVDEPKGAMTLRVIRADVPKATTASAGGVPLVLSQLQDSVDRVLE